MAAAVLANSKKAVVVLVTEEAKGLLLPWEGIFFVWGITDWSKFFLKDFWVSLVRMTFSFSKMLLTFLWANIGFGTSRCSLQERQPVFRSLIKVARIIVTGLSSIVCQKIVLLTTENIRSEVYSVDLVVFVDENAKYFLQEIEAIEAKGCPPLP
jgi:hypothetical protein